MNYCATRPFNNQHALRTKAHQKIWLIQNGLNVLYFGRYRYYPVVDNPESKVLSFCTYEEYLLRVYL